MEVGRIVSKNLCDCLHCFFNNNYYYYAYYNVNNYIVVGKYLNDTNFKVISPNLLFVYVLS